MGGNNYPIYNDRLYYYYFVRTFYSDSAQAVNMLLIGFALMGFLKSVSSDLTNAVSDFEMFLHAELETVDTLNNYLNLEFERLINLKKDVLAYKSTITNGVTKGVDNPVQFYLVIKNVTSQWNSIDSYNVTNISFAEIHTALDRIVNHREKNNITIPVNDDLHDSLKAVARLQDMYKLSNTDVINGKLAGMPKTTSTLDAHDCLQLGKIFFTKRQYNRSVSWMERAMVEMEKEGNQTKVTKKTILKHYAYALYKQGKESESVEILRDFLNSLDTHEHFYDYLTTTNLEELKPKNQSNSAVLAPGGGMYLCDQYNCSNDYKSLCNGEINNMSYTNPSLSCYYKTDSPFLKLAPIKVEVVHHNPDVYFFRQVVSDEEIETVVTMAKSKLNDARTGGGGSKGLKSDYRTAKVAWFADNTSSTVEAISRRIHDMTDLNMKFAEPLQLSSPEAGGATVFPLAKVTAYPQKNDALLWYNTMKNGTRDFYTLHAGCPVLSGKKWVANKWIHSFGQEFIRQCSLEQTE